jgi:O-antigen/teichoic acid export membrane protein
VRRRPAATSILGRGMSGAAARVAEGGLGVVLVIITARFMGPEGRGLFALASLTALVCGMILGPAWTAMAAELTHGRLRPSGVVGMSLVLAACAGITVAAVAIILSVILVDQWWVVAIPALATPFILMARYAEGLHLSLGGIRAVNLITIGRIGLPLVGVTSAIALSAGDAAIVAAWTLGLVALGIAVIPGAMRSAGGVSVPRGRALYRRVILRGVVLAVPGSSLALSTRLALVVLAAMATAATVGVYSVAIAATEVLFIATNALVAATFERVRETQATESASLTARTVRHTVLLTIACGALLVPAVIVMLPTLVGPGYGAVPVLCALLIPGIAGLALFGPVQTFLAVRHDTPRATVTIAASGLAANVVLAPLLVWGMGVIGAALAATASNLLVATLAAHRFSAVSGLRMGSLIPGRSDAREYLHLARSAGIRLAGHRG